MQITKKIPQLQKYILTADDQWVKSEMHRLKMERIEKEKVHNYLPAAVQSEEELRKEIENREFSVSPSHSSFQLSEVTSFTFGPFVSRFWMLRKHTISMDLEDLEKDAPFYGWNCITLSISHKWDIYLIIRNDRVMSDFIKLLIYKTETVDGVRGSAIALKKERLRQRLKSLK